MHLATLGPFLLPMSITGAPNSSFRVLGREGKTGQYLVNFYQPMADQLALFVKLWLSTGSLRKLLPRDYPWLHSFLIWEAPGLVMWIQ